MRMRGAIHAVAVLVLLVGMGGCEASGGGGGGYAYVPNDADDTGDAGGDADDDGGACAPAASCEAAGAECGNIGDGCGGTLECGGCIEGQTCGGGGVPNHCGEGECTPATCESAGAECGPLSDGCSDVLDCGGCEAPLVCAAAGTPNSCEEVPCAPQTCESAGADCGLLGDGCGGTLDCGSCTAPEVCGGGGAPNTCGTAACVPKTCAALEAECGSISDGCEGVLDCGGCEAPLECAAAGTANKCEEPACEPKTCEELGVECGSAGNGCGGSLDCGTCGDGSTCEEGACVSICGDAPCGPLWSTACSGSGGYKVCGADPESGCLTESLFISCQFGNSCTGSECGGGCAVPEALFVVDRSSSMEGPVWEFTRDTLISFTEDVQSAVRLGMRPFPGASSCEPGEVIPLALDNAAAFASGLVAPSAASSTPLADALAGLGPSFGDPTQGEHVILMTDGSETCDTVEAVYDSVRLLRNRGTRVHTIGLGSGFDAPLLEELAAKGGGTFTSAASGAELEAVLQDLLAQISGCPHTANGLSGCLDGVCGAVVCDETYNLCDGGCYAADDPEHCGADCLSCPVPDGAGEAVCVEGACEMVCDTGYHLCDGTCVTDYSIDSCGSSCTPCPTVAGAGSTCDGFFCGFDCPIGTIYCGGECVAGGCCDVIENGQLVINEIMSDPDGTDYNGDGTYSGVQDEWLELLNRSGTPLELEGLAIWDALDERHVFGPLCLQPGEAVLIFGGGATTLDIPGATVMVADSTLALNNSGDLVELIDWTFNTVDFFEYSPLSGQSWVRSPEGSGPFVKHSEAPDSGGADASPGTCASGGNFPSCLGGAQ